MLSDPFAGIRNSASFLRMSHSDGQFLRGVSLSGGGGGRGFKARSGPEQAKRVEGCKFKCKFRFKYTLARGQTL